MLFRVSRQYQKGGETPCAEFVDRADAELFIERKREEDLRLKVPVTYHLYQGAVHLETFAEAVGEAASSSGSTQQSSARVSPTPFSTVPRPSGMPAQWGRGEEDKDRGGSD